jgi:prepilin-type N-terminal cleavage/methylation domain-containing protein
MLSRGFTLIELMVTLAVVAILGAIATWQIHTTLPGYRVGHAARRFLADVRMASSLAARTNEPVHLVVDPAAAGCGPSWSLLVGASPAAPRTVIDRVCLDAEAPGVSMSAGDLDAEVKCSADLDQDAFEPCSLCEKDARLTFYPTGEVVAVRGGEVLDAGHAIVFSPKVEPITTRTLAVGVRAGTGEARLYRPTGAGWECP